MSRPSRRGTWRRPTTELQLAHQVVEFEFCRGNRRGGADWGQRLNSEQRVSSARRQFPLDAAQRLRVGRGT